MPHQLASRRLREPPLHPPSPPGAGLERASGPFLVLAQGTARNVETSLESNSALSNTATAKVVVWLASTKKEPHHTLDPGHLRRCVPTPKLNRFEFSIVGSISMGPSTASHPDASSRCLILRGNYRDVVGNAIVLWANVEQYAPFCSQKHACAACKLPNMRPRIVTADCSGSMQLPSFNACCTCNGALVQHCRGACERCSRVCTPCSVRRAPCRPLQSSAHQLCAPHHASLPWLQMVH